MTNQESSIRPLQEGFQGESDANVAKELSDREFNDLASRTLFEFGRNAVLNAYGPVRRGEQTEVVGDVSQRPGEKEIVLEAGIEHLYVNACIRHNLPVYIIGEHHEYASPRDNGSITNRRHITFFDAVDNTGEYIANLPAPLYAVASIYSLDGRSVGGIIGNIKDKKMYIARDGKNYLLDLETEGEKEIKPSQRTSIKDKGFCIASYLGQPKYTLSGSQSLSELLKEMVNTEDAMVQPHSGSFIYSTMAEGAVDAYIMVPSEPLSEFLPGWIIAQNAGFQAYTLNLGDGTYQELNLDLNKYKNNPDEYRKEKIPNLLVVRSPQIRDELVLLLVKAHKENELRQIKDLFIESRYQDFNTFKSS